MGQVRFRPGGESKMEWTHTERFGPECAALIRAARAGDSLAHAAWQDWLKDHSLPEFDASAGCPDLVGLSPADPFVQVARLVYSARADAAPDTVYAVTEGGRCNGDFLIVGTRQRYWIREREDGRLELWLWKVGRSTYYKTFAKIPDTFAVEEVER